MPIVTPPPHPGSGGRGQPPHVIHLQPPNLPRGVLIALLALILAALLVGYWWFVQRIEVESGEVLVLVNRMGQRIPAQHDGAPLPAFVHEQVVLYPALLKMLGEHPDSNRYKGIKYQVLPEGRYFYDPFLWKRMIVKAERIPQDEAGILIRRYGHPLPPGKIVATEPHERGPLAAVLMPDRYNINPFAYDVTRVPVVTIKAGCVGVQTLYHGDEPNNPNAWVVAAGERGVQPDVLAPGRYYNNPYVRKIAVIDVRSHTLDLRGDDAIFFPSKDSFEIMLEATVEYAISRAQAPYVMMAIGDHQDIETKLILPYVRSLARIEGSKLLAREFITGETREAFQGNVFDGLRKQSAEQGIEIRATLIRRIEPPTAIANPISERQIADQQIKQYQSEIEVANAQAKLVEQQELSKQNRAIGEANRAVVTEVKQSEQAKAVALTEANQRLAVAKLRLEAAREEAAALISRGEADAEVILLNFQAEAEPLRDAIAAFGSGEAYAQYFFYQKLSPAMKSILASTDGPFADIFRALSEAPSPTTAPTDGKEGE